MRVSLNITVAKVQVPDIAGQPGPGLEGLAVRVTTEMNQKELQAYAKTVATAMGAMLSSLQQLKDA